MTTDPEKDVKRVAVVTVAVADARAAVDDEDEEDEDDVDAAVVAVAAPAVCCGRGQIRILGVLLSASRIESGSWLNDGRINLMFALGEGVGGCTDTAMGAPGTGT
jgi:hypothetical protein